MTYLRSIKIIYVALALAFTFASSSRAVADSLTDVQIRQEVLVSVEKVCQKPKDAGQYWDIEVEAGGSATIGIKKLVGLGVEGEIELNKKEWSGIQSSVGDFTDYRDCVKNMMPYMLPKLGTLQSKTTTSQSLSNRVLGGVQWKRRSHGVSMTLNKCTKVAESISCDLTIVAEEKDLEFHIEGNSYLFDQLGRRFTVVRGQIANFEQSFKSTSYSVDAVLIHGVKARVVLDFGNVANDANLVSKLYVATKVSGKKTSYSYRDIKILLE